MTRPDAFAPTSWKPYLEWFHGRRAGITEDILAATRGDRDGASPYQWLLNAAQSGCLALDVACGSAPLSHLDPEHRWVGIDQSSSELLRAASQSGSRYLRGAADALPFHDASFGLVVCSMALMLVENVDVVLTEIHRVLLPTGTAIFLLPGSRPLSGRDRFRYLQLLAALRQFQPAYPNRIHLVGLRRHLTRTGFNVIGDERRRFRYLISDRPTSRRLVESLYAPRRSHKRVESAVGVTDRWIGSEVGIPIRRIVCRKARVTTTPDHR